MSYSALKTALLGKKETTPGADAVPAAATDAIRILPGAVPNMDVSPMEYDVVKQTFGKRVGPLDARAMSLDVEFYMRSGGGLGVAPDYASILHAASHTVTANAGVDVRVNPITAQGSSRHTSSFYYFHDGLLYKYIGAVCSAYSIEYPLDGLIKGKATIVAPFQEPTQATLPAGLSYQSSEPIQPKPGDSIVDAGTPIRVGTFTFDAGLAGGVRRLIGGEEANVTGRDRSKITISKDSLGTVADVTRLTGVTAGVFSAVCGQPGNRITLSAQKAYYGSLKSEPQDALMMRSIDLLLDETAGDDAYQIVID